MNHRPNSTYSNNSKVNLLGYQHKFLEDLRDRGRSSNTIKNYKTDLECFNQYVKDIQNNLTIAEFSGPHLEEYSIYLQKRYSSDNSRRRRIQTLRIFFDFLVKYNVFPTNPVRGLSTSPKFLDVPRPTPLVDIKTLWTYFLEEASAKNPMVQLLAQRNQIILLLVFGTGLKVSDMSKLKSSQILKGEPSRVLITPRKRDPYSIPLPNIFPTVYDKYYQLLEQMKQQSSIEFSEILFNANPYCILSGGLSPRGLEIIFEELRKKLLLTLTPKSLRQACIFKWIHQRKKDSLIKEWMGVSPSYSLKLYKEHSSQYCYSDDFLAELYHHYDKKKG